MTRRRARFGLAVCETRLSACAPNTAREYSVELFRVLCLNALIRWPRELNALQIEKNTCKKRKQLPQFDKTRCKCSQHNQIKKRAANRKKHLQIKKILSSIWQHTCCKCSQHNQKRNTLLWAFAMCFFICLWAFAFAPSAVKMMKMCFLKLQRVELSRPPYFKLFWMFKLSAVALSWASF